TLVYAIAIARKEEEIVVKGHRLLRRLCDLAAAEDPLVGTATELAELCSDLTDTPSTTDVSATLRRYGFTTKSKRKGSGIPKYRYELSHAHLADLIARYMGSIEDQAE